MKVKDIMKRDVVSLRPDMSAGDAIGLLFKLEISGLPVIDESGRLLGMFTEKDVLKNILPSYIEKVGRFIYEENPKSIKKKFMGIINLSVSQLMRKDVITVDEDASLCEVAHLILTKKVRRIPVLDRQNRVIGVVAREDIIKAYVKEAGCKIE